MTSDNQSAGSLLAHIVVAVRRADARPVGKIGLGRQRSSFAIREWLAALSAGFGLVVATTSIWSYLYPRGVPRGFEVNPYVLIGIAIVVGALLIVDQLGGLYFHGFLAVQVLEPDRPSTATATRRREFDALS
jgi:hypothetical protein